MAAARPDPNVRELALLALLLEQGPGFRLGLANCDTAATRDANLGRLGALMADRPVHITRLDLARSPGDELLLTRLREHLQANPAPEGKRPAVMVVGLCIGREVNDPSLVDGGTKALARVRGGA